MPSSSEVAEFQQLMTGVADHASGEVSSLGDDFDAYPEMIDPYIAAAGQLTAEWYDSLNPGVFPVETAPPPARAALLANAYWASTQPDTTQALSGAAQRQVFGASRDTVLHNAAREKVRFARYASATACPWCRVLATRGAVYHTDASAAAGHDNCHCIAVPVRSGNPYTPPDYVDTWTDDYEQARREVGGNLDDIVNYLRKASPQRG